MTRPLPLLVAGQSAAITLSQEQVAVLLANSFLSTFPRRNKRGGEYANYPDINMNRMLRWKARFALLVALYFTRYAPGTYHTYPSGKSRLFYNRHLTGYRYGTGYCKPDIRHIQVPVCSWVFTSEARKSSYW